MTKSVNPACAPLPPRAGIGLKPQHYTPLLDGLNDAVRPFWVEVHPQNYFHDGGVSRHWLSRVAEAVPVSFHSTGLSLGSADGPDIDQLERLARLCDAVPAASVSDHVSWSRTAHTYFPDLLPLPYTEQSLERMAASVGQVQDRLHRRILVENPSRMLAFADDTMAEEAFIARLCARAGCGLLLDINNIVVSATNIGIDAAAYLDAIDPALVGEIHLAGHAVEHHDIGPLAIDDHGSAVGETCWALYADYIGRAGPIPTLIERDNDVPEYAVLIAEARRADHVLRAHAECSEQSRRNENHPLPSPVCPEPVEGLHFLQAVVK
ncbi:MAG: DUF692 domain-containing protein [Sphingopyxis sp.]